MVGAGFRYRLPGLDSFSTRDFNSPDCYFCSSAKTSIAKSDRELLPELNDPPGPKKKQWHLLAFGLTYLIANIESRPLDERVVKTSPTTEKRVRNFRFGQIQTRYIRRVDKSNREAEMPPSGARLAAFLANALATFPSRLISVKAPTGQPSFPYLRGRMLASSDRIPTDYANIHDGGLRSRYVHTARLHR